MAMTREQSQALSLARARRRRAEAEQNPGILGKVDAAVRGVADGLTLGFADEIAAGLGAATGIGGTFGDYYGNLEAQRSRDERDENKSGGVRLAGQLAGGVALPVGAARNGVTLMREGASLGTNMLRGAGEAAIYGAASGAGSSTEGKRAEGAAYGAGFGALAGGAAAPAAAGIARIAEPVVGAIRNNVGAPAAQAVNRVGTALRGQNINDAALRMRLSDLGPEAALVDVMGTRGQALARAASNVSPEARATLEGFSGPRMAEQPNRMASALEEASGLPARNRQTVEGLKEAAYEQAAPGIRAAYDRARAAGYDLPLEDFQEIIGSPMGRRAFAEASRAVQNRMAAGNEGAISNLALLDAMKRRLDAMGQVAGRSGDNDKAGQAASLSQALRRQMDGLLEGGEYAEARGLREAAYRTDDAFDTGADLAARRVPLDAPARARGGAGQQGPVRPEVGQGYAATLSEEILNRRGTPDSLNRLSAPMQQEAMDAALGGGADRVRQQLGRERVFGETHRALTGNSTTARQLAEMGVTAGAGAGLGLVGGLDWQQAGLAGVATALARRGATKAIGAIRSGNEEVVAREIADILVRRGIPTTPKGVSVALRDPRKSEFMARLLAAEGGQAAGAIQAQ